MGYSLRLCCPRSTRTITLPIFPIVIYEVRVCNKGSFNWLRQGRAGASYHSHTGKTALRKMSQREGEEERQQHTIHLQT